MCAGWVKLLDMLKVLAKRAQGNMGGLRVSCLRDVLRMFTRRLRELGAMVMSTWHEGHTPLGAMQCIVTKCSQHAMILTRQGLCH